MEEQDFKSMLHFIYNDGLPEIEKSDDVFVMAQHLLVVADRNKLERLKLICVDKLIDTSKVAIVTATTLAFHGLKRKVQVPQGNRLRVMALSI
ncbi:BTB/POZ and MATH domain-containing protein 2-like [Panicum miliaceum]|uniref:BTB/POZ and MATH domain-containing protein 2-like n=1 Tax=Panicum miliaceum TaxID=4540 RepID=A0A3L6TDM0_PANMI|nr:BTB/POZ and MATH domain-containing protein 2-like [Panicum miliaceum]